MRGFAFVGGEAPDFGFDAGVAQGDIIVAADSGLHQVEARGLRADWIVGDMDSLEDLSLLKRYPADRVRSFPSDKDDTDTEIALHLLAELGCGERVVVGGGGGRLDHLLAIASLFDREEAPDRWLTRGEDCLLLAPDRGRGRIESYVPPGAMVSVFPCGSGPWRARSSGLKWPLDGVSWERGSFGVSNESTANGRFSIAAEAGRFFLVLPLGASASFVR